MAFVDYYKALGIDKKATEKDIKSAYRKLARKYHPDVNPNDKEAHKKFQEINEANEVLSDPEKRKKYDEYGKDWKHADQYEQAKSSRGPQYARSGESFSGGYGETDFSDFFSSMFGGGARSSGRGQQIKYRGQDFNAELHLNLRDAYTTHQQTLTVNGKNIRITIPAGIENGQTIIIKGHGGPGSNNGPNGDLYIHFNIVNDPDFKREGNNLYTTSKIDLYTAVLGGEQTINTLSGKVKLKISPGTQNGTKVKLKGKGFPLYKRDGEFGDLYVTYQVNIPVNLTEKQKELFTQLSQL